METDSYQSKSLASLLSVRIISLVTIIFVAIISTNYFISRTLLEDYIQNVARTQAKATVFEIGSVFNQVAISADSLASLVSTNQLDVKQIHESIKAYLATNKDIYGMTVALEPNTLFSQLGDFSPYYYRVGDSIAYSDLADKSYEYKNWDWYTEPQKLKSSIWSEPYLDDGGGNTLMVTYSTPVYNKDRSFAGVATADIKLSWLNRLVRNIKVGDSGYGFILSKNDIVIAHPDKKSGLISMGNNEIDPAVWQQYQDSKQHNETVYMNALCNNRSESCWLALDTLGETGWKVAIVIPEQELTESIHQLTVTISLIAVFGLVILFTIIMYIVRHQTEPLYRLTAATRNIGTGNLDTKIPETTQKNEIGLLATEFETMRIALNKYIDDIREATAKQQKLESELSIAEQIQVSMIPGHGECFIERDHLQIFARLRPARSVGGDLYFYEQSGSSLNFIIGDVSDKGIPAALFMAKTVTLYTRALKDELNPGETLTMMNDILVKDNDACMFVTALCGRLNLNNGTLVMANAGHMDPIIKSGSHTAEITNNGGTALGLMEDIEYTDNHHQFKPGSSLIMYTDGISEAHDSEGEQYGDDRLTDHLSQEQSENTKIIGTNILKAVDEHAAGTEQFDDITLLIIRYQ